MSHDQESRAFNLETSEETNQGLRQQSPSGSRSAPIGNRPRVDVPGSRRSESPPSIRHGERTNDCRGSTTLSGNGSDSVSVHDTQKILKSFIEAYADGEINFARAIRRGNSLIHSRDTGSEETQDRLILDFYTSIEDTERRKLERRAEERGEGEKEGDGTVENRISPLERGSPGPSDEHRGLEKGWVRVSEKFREDELPWFQYQGNAGKLTDSMRKTREIIEQLSKDIPTVKRWVESAAGAP